MHATLPLLALSAAALTAPLAPAQCHEWTPGFHANGANGRLLALRAFDDGTGTKLYAGGAFQVAGEAVASRVARFDGNAWSALGASGANGVNHNVNALVEWNDGTGLALYAGGSFTEAAGVFAQGVARWNGTSWSALSTTTDQEVQALAVFDAGAGPELYAGGSFTTIGGVTAQHVARWNGSAWSEVGGGTSHTVRALHVHDDGSGPALWVGGDFASVNGIAAQGLARWNGTSWSFPAPLLGGSVYAITTTIESGASKLVIGGTINAVAGIPVSLIARWNGTSWSALGSGLNNTVRALRSFDDGTGPELWVGGDFTSAGGILATAIARWNGTSWSNPGAALTGSLSDTPTRVYALEVFDDPVAGVPRLVVGGTFTHSANQLVNGHVAWDGSSWATVGSSGSGLTTPWFQWISSLAVLPDPIEPVLCAIGSIGAAGGPGTIARWNGTSWSPMPGVQLTGFTTGLEALDVGAGPTLHAVWSTSSFQPDVARWNGAGWDSLAGVGLAPTSLAVFDDGAGPKLYATGFSPNALYAGDVLRRWNGTSWEELAGGGLDNSWEGNALIVHDDGTGPALYVGGLFFWVGTSLTPAWHVARWNGTSWTGLGTSASGLGTGVTALAVFDDGTGSRLYAGGNFTGCVKRWEGGTTWSLVGGGLGTSVPVNDFVVFDDGSGPALYATGYFQPLNGGPFPHVARWNGTSWSGLQSGLDAPGASLAIYDDGHGTGPALYVAGSFGSAGDTGSSRIARFGGCRVSEFCAGDGLDPSVTTPCPCANTGASGRGCAWSGSSGGARLEIDGRIDPDTIVLRGSLMPGTTTAIYLKGGATNVAGTVFGDGVRCVDGTLIRLGIKQNSGGASQFPEPGNLPVSVRGGTPPGSGLVGYYQTYFRAASPTFCPPATFNVTNGIEIRW